MSDDAVTRRRAELLARVKRRRKEVEQHLDNFFYSRCREVLKIVRSIDATNKLAGTTAGSLSTDATRPAQGWLTVQHRLDEYDYAQTSNFIEDMRAVVNHCYDTHGRDSAVAKVARDVELAMEDQFVRALAFPPIDVQQIAALARRAPKSAKLTIVETIAFYNDKQPAVAPGAQRVTFSPNELRNAARYRILQLLQNAARQTPTRERPPPPSAPRKTPLAPPAAHPRAEPPRPTPSKTLLAGPDSPLPFHEEGVRDLREAPAPPSSSSATAVQLERVPQNDPKEIVTTAIISPVVMGADDDDISDDFCSTSDEGEGEAP